MEDGGVVCCQPSDMHITALCDVADYLGFTTWTQYTTALETEGAKIWLRAKK